METEFANQPIEIQHWGRYDVLINRELPDQQTVNNLVVKIKSDYDAAPDQNLFETWTSREGQKTNVLFDRVENPHYCAKIKYITRCLPTDTPLSLKEFQTFDSLMSEISLYDLLNSAISSDEFQKVATTRGFSELRTTPPLLGLINRDTQEKIMIYQYLDGSTLADDFEARDITSELEILFSEEGIIAKDIDGDTQLMVVQEAGKKNLYLIDLEGYYSKVKNKSN